MASEVIANLPKEVFHQVHNSSDNLNSTTSCSVFDGFVLSSDPKARVHQLEQNIKFLQEQHQIMLGGLHQEIEHLRMWNRDLQFKLVFCKGGVALLQSSPSSSEEDSIQKKLVLSPNQVTNITPLQVEILERDVAELKNNLSEARTRNVYLQNIVDEQKKKLLKANEGKENKMKSSAERQEGVAELQDKMEDAERLIRRLRRENEEQRKEIISLRTSRPTLERRDSHRGYYRNQQLHQSRFPPLQAHNQYNGIKNYDYRNAESGLEKDSQVIGKPAPMLPHLRDRNHATTSSGYPHASTYAPQPDYSGGHNGHKKNYYRKQQDESERYRGGGGGRGVRGNHHRPHE